jgi:two-component system response regulator (stage 0 sporulation protein A)
MQGAVRVLLADDNRDYAILLKEYLRSHPQLSLVGVAHDGVHALELVQATQPDVLVLDMIMPRLDGIGVLDRMRQLPLVAQPRVIVLTALGQEDMTRRTLELGASYYIMKPFDLEVLAERILQVHADSNAVEADPVPDDFVVEKVTRHLRDLDIPSTVNGYTYLQRAVALAIIKPSLLDRITRGLYPAVAAQFETTPARVERSMRHAIEVGWAKGSNERLVKLFGFSRHRRKGKPTNSEFIGLLAETVRNGKGFAE